MAERHDRGKWLFGAALRTAQRRGQLEQRERVALGLDHHALANPERERREAATQQHVRGVVVERAQLVLGEAGVFEEAAADGPRTCEERDSHPVHTPGHERERGRARPVEPRDVVDDDRDRTALPRGRAGAPRSRCQRRAAPGPCRRRCHRRCAAGLAPPSAVDRSRRAAEGATGSRPRN